MSILTKTLVGVALVGFLGVSLQAAETCCGAEATKQVAQAKAADKATATTPTTKEQTTCPIMGGKINKKFFADADGKRVYFCCGACPAKFQKDPAKYIKQLEDAGVTLEKTPAPEKAATTK